MRTTPDGGYAYGGGPYVGEAAGAAGAVVVRMWRTAGSYSVAEARPRAYTAAVRVRIRNRGAAAVGVGVGAGRAARKEAAR